MRYYAGIGSRETPFDIQLLLFDLAAKLGQKYTLRSGHAKGADLAFENGCVSINGGKEIFKAKDCTPESIEFTSQFHPAWENCTTDGKKLHGRNAMIVMGKDLKTPVERVICWCYEKDGEWFGGTGQGLRIAKAHDIPIYNLYFEDVRKKFYEFVYWGKK